MADKKKAAAVVAGVGVVGLAYLLATRVRAAPRVPGARASVSIEVLDSEGRLVPHHSPFDLIEGETYTLNVHVTNQSTRAGEPCEATLTVRTTVNIPDDGFLIPPTTETYSFGPGELHTFSYTLSIPLGYGGLTGAIFAEVFDPDGNHIVTASELIRIIPVEINYAATVALAI